MAEERSQPSNETLLILTGCFASLANRFANPQVVLPWLYNYLGGPLFLVGFLAPSVRLGSLLAQVTVVPSLLKRPTRKWAYVASVSVSAVVLVMISSTMWGMGRTAGLVVFFLCLVLLGASSGVTALTMQEVTAKTLPRDRIGRVLSLQVSASGIILLIVMSALMYFQTDIKQGEHKSLMMLLAAAAWAMAGLTFSRLREPASAVTESTTAWSEIVSGWRFVQEIPWFRRFVLVRSLFLSVGLATPFYSVHAAREFSLTAHSLSLIVIATGITGVLSAPVWSRILERDPRRALFRSGLFAALAGLIVVIHEFRSDPHPLVYMVVFAFLQLAVQGLTQSSKTYLALMCPEDDRPRYLAISNAILGGLGVMVSGLVGVLAGSVHIYAALGLLVVLSLAASAAARSLYSPQEEN